MNHTHAEDSCYGPLSTLVQVAGDLRTRLVSHHRENSETLAESMRILLGTNTDVDIQVRAALSNADEQYSVAIRVLDEIIDLTNAELNGS